VNWKQVAGNWLQFRGIIREQWTKLTEEHLDFIGGNRELLIGRIRQLYGMSQDQTEKQVTAWTKRVTAPAHVK